MNNNFLQFAVEISEKAGNRLKKSFKAKNPTKRGTSKEVKSVYDNIVDDLIKKGIQKKYPDHSYLTEEAGLVDKSGDYLWIIDPLDGTGNFENHNPFYSVSVSLWKSGKPVLGVVEAPSLDERFIGVKEKGAWLKDLEKEKKKSLEVSNCKKLKNSYFIYCEGGERSRKRIISNFEEVYSKTKDFRKIGSAALELSWIASGRAEGYVTYQIPIWDIAAGLIILSESGGSLFSFNQDGIDLNDMDLTDERDLVATNGKVALDLNLQ